MDLATARRELGLPATAGRLEVATAFQVRAVRIATDLLMAPPNLADTLSEELDRLARARDVLLDLPGAGGAPITTAPGDGAARPARTALPEQVREPAPPPARTAPPEPRREPQPAPESAETAPVETVPPQRMPVEPVAAPTPTPFRLTDPVTEPAPPEAAEPVSGGEPEVAEPSTERPDRRGDGRDRRSGQPDRRGMVPEAWQPTAGSMSESFTAGPPSRRISPGLVVALVVASMMLLLGFFLGLLRG